MGQGPDLGARTTPWAVEEKVLLEVVIEVFASSFLIASVISVQQGAGSSGRLRERAAEWRSEEW